MGRSICQQGSMAPGRKLIEQAFAKHALDMEETMSVLRPREREDLVRLLKKVGLWVSARAESDVGER